MKSLSPKTVQLVDDFAEAMKAKLLDAQLKHGWTDDWVDLGELQLQQMLKEHVGKGDPVDVANICAFAWYHGHKTA